MYPSECFYSDLLIFMNCLMSSHITPNTFFLQGLAGFPGGKGDEGPKGEDVSEIALSVVPP